MSLPIYDDPAETTLWHVDGYGEERYPPGRDYRWFNAERKTTQHVVAQLTLEGRVALEDHTGIHLAGPGDLLLFRHGDKSSYGKVARQEAYACRWIHLVGAGLPEHLEAFRARHGCVQTVGLRGPIVEQLGHLISLADPVAATPRTTMAHAAHALMIQLFEHAERRLRQRLSPVEQAVAMILENPHRPWSLKQVAAEAGVSREHLSRVFTQRLGVSPFQHLKAARVRRALQLLRDTELPLREVAEQSGLISTHNLARHIRSAEGMSPNAVRESRQRAADA